MNQPQQSPEWLKQVAGWLKRQPRWVLVVGVLAFLALGAWLLSDMHTPAADQTLPGVNGDPLLNSTGLALDVFIRLILVVIAIYIGAVLLRRWQSGGSRKMERQLALLETLHLSQRRAVHLVRAGEQVFLIGATDQSVSLLGQVPAGSEAGASPADLTFDQHLSIANHKKNDPTDFNQV